ADHGNRSVKLLRHGVLLVFGAPCQLRLLAGPEHGRTIPLADMSGPLLPRCTALTCYTPMILGSGVSAMKRREFITLLGGAAAGARGPGLHLRNAGRIGKASYFISHRRKP